jgi:membrane peptidoglycan carboxypeptidase
VGGFRGVLGHRWTRWCVVALGTASLVIGPASWGYALTGVPPRVESPQASVLLFSDGRTELARVGTTDRRQVPLRAVPRHLRDAVLAAEDRGFYEHSGVSARGVGRALWANVTSGGAEGASTITQQYARNAYLSQDRTVRRKAREAVLAVKLERRLSKDQILERYLNTIYFGRGAYGIDSASRAYFGVGVERVTLAQAAVLAAVIKDPYHLDPAVDPVASRDRWLWIVNTMDGRELTYPTVLPYAAADPMSGPTGAVVARVEHELSRLGVTAQQLHTGGLRVVTTIDAGVQRELVAQSRAAGRAAGGAGAAAVAVQPSTGAVRGYYAGERGYGFFDDATAPRRPGLLFQPVALATALGEGIGFGSRWDGTSPRSFADRHGVALYNRDNVQCPACRLDDALSRGLNTPYYALAEQLGPDAVARTAKRAGIPDAYPAGLSLADGPGEPTPGHTRADVALGHYPVAATDLAAVYATFGAGGRHAPSHFVAEVGFPGEKNAYRPERPEPRRALTAEVVADVSYVLSRDDDRARDTAAVHATVPFGAGADISDAWCARYTSRLAVVAWLGHNTPARLVVRGHGRSAAEAVGRVCGAALRESRRAGPPPPFPPPAYLGRTDTGTAAVPEPAMPTLVVPSPDTTTRGTAQPTRSAPTEPHPERTSSPSPSPSAIPTASPQAGGGEDQLNETE